MSHSSSITKKTESGYKKSENIYNNLWLAVVIFFGGTILLGGIAYLGGYGRFSDIVVTGKGGFVIPKSIILILSIVAILIVADAMTMTYKETYKNNYTRINTVLFFCQLVSFCFWPLFLFSLNIPLVASIFLAISIIISIYLVFRFFCVSIYGGILYSIWFLWLLFLFVVTFANFLTN